MHYKLLDLVHLIENQNIQEIMTVLNDLNIGLRNLFSSNKDWYFIMLENDLVRFKELLNNDNKLTVDCFAIQNILQSCILRGNEYAEQEKKMNGAIYNINTLLDGNNPVETFRALINENAMLPQGLKEYAAPLYHFELQLAKQDKKDDLTHEELSAAVEVLQCVAAVNSALDSNSSDPLYNALTLSDSYFENLNPGLGNCYLESLKRVRDSKLKCKNPLLTHSEIQTIIEECNARAVYENQRRFCLERINNCLKHGGHKTLMPILMDPCMGLSKLNIDSSELYFYALQLERNRKRKLHNSDDLWLDDVRSGINVATDILIQASRLGLKLTAINLALDKQDAVEIYHYLTNKDFYISNVIRDCKEIYLQRMLEVRRFKLSEPDCQSGSGWIQCRLPERPMSFCYNVKDRCLLWSKPEEGSNITLVKDASLLNREELQAIIDMVNCEFKRELLFLSNEEFVIRLQSQIRGFLVREKLRSRWNFFKSNVRKIVQIQSKWRMIKKRKEYISRKKYFECHLKLIVIVQSVWRMKICRKQYVARLNLFKFHEKQIITIQSFWKALQIRNDYQALMKNKVTSIKVIKRFLYLLENSFNDYQEEIEIQSLKQQISNAIRQNRLLEEEIEEMDLKIGLLVRNRISLQEVLNQNINLKNFRSYLETNNEILEPNNDLIFHNTMNKTARQKIESYQHLFYLLQTNPNYLANLVFEMPHMQQTKFVETVIFSLYNYGSSNRDEYLLLRLFKRAVESEINTKIHNHPSDFLSANPFVVKLIVGLCRTAHAQESLKTILQPLIKSVIEDHTLKINTSPVEVYKHWVNELEVNSGSPCGLPYDITSQAAMKYPEVRNVIEKSVTQLKQTCQRFIRALLKHPERLPYSMRYMAKVINNCLQAKFPSCPEKDILKVVGNLIYYRYINSAIVAPDAFDMLDRNIAEILPPDKRRNLASVAKLLQFATTNKGFGFESAHLAEVLNPFIRQCHERFKEYFREVCRVDDPEKNFNIDQYSDLVSITKPVIRMTVKEIRDTQNLLIQYQDAIAPSPNDPLHELLSDLGESYAADFCKDTSGSKSNENTDIWLTLSPKHENHIVNQFDCSGASGDRSIHYSTNSRHLENSKDKKPRITQNDIALDSLYIHTKRMIVDMLNCMDFPTSSYKVKSSSNPITLVSFLNRSIKWYEDSRHNILLQNRQKLDLSLTPAKRKLSHTKSYVMEINLNLEEKRKHIRNNLALLESAEIVSSSNDYQEMLNSIRRDIRTLRAYRCHRKDEIKHLKDIFHQLGIKRQFQEDQMDYYEKYCQSCLENMTKKPKHQRSRTHSTSNSQKLNHSTNPNNNTSIGSPNNGFKSNINKKTIKFSAYELRKKGVILEIDGLSNSQYKNLQFEITRNIDSFSSGKFDVTAKFMGVQMDKVCLLFSDLLQLQYEGTNVMRMFDRATINVNLLVFLLNKKFFAK